MFSAHHANTTASQHHIVANPPKLTPVSGKLLLGPNSGLIEIKKGIGPPPGDHQQQHQSTYTTANKYIHMQSAPNLLLKPQVRRAIAQCDTWEVGVATSDGGDHGGSSIPVIESSPTDFSSSVVNVSSMLKLGKKKVVQKQKKQLQQAFDSSSFSDSQYCTLPGASNSSRLSSSTCHENQPTPTNPAKNQSAASHHSTSSSSKRNPIYIVQNTLSNASSNRSTARSSLKKDSSSSSDSGKGYEVISTASEKCIKSTITVKPQSTSTSSSSQHKTKSFFTKIQADAKTWKQHLREASKRVLRKQTPASTTVVAAAESQSSPQQQQQQPTSFQTTPKFFPTQHHIHQSSPDISSLVSSHSSSSAEPESSRFSSRQNSLTNKSIQLSTSTGTSSRQNSTNSRRGQMPKILQNLTPKLIRSHAQQQQPMPAPIHYPSPHDIEITSTTQLNPMPTTDIRPISVQSSINSKLPAKLPTTTIPDKQQPSNQLKSLSQRTRWSKLDLSSQTNTTSSTSTTKPQSTTGSGYISSTLPKKYNNNNTTDTQKWYYNQQVNSGYNTDEWCSTLPNPKTTNSKKSSSYNNLKGFSGMGKLSKVSTSYGENGLVNMTIGNTQHHTRSSRKNLDHYASSEVMRNSSLKLLQTQLQTAKKEISLRSTEIVKLRASIQDLTGQISSKPKQQKTPGQTRAKFGPAPQVAAATAAPSASTASPPTNYYKRQVEILQQRLNEERSEHRHERQRWDKEKMNVLKYQNQLQSQYTNLVDAYAAVSTVGSQVSVGNHSTLRK